MHRVKNIDYDADDLYSDEDEEQLEAGEEQGYTAEDRENLATLSPVVRAELDEAGLHASDKEIEDALWHYYWDVGKSVTYLKNSKRPKPSQQPREQAKKEKPKSKFDQAAERNAGNAEVANSKQATNGLAKKTEGLKIAPNPADTPSPKARSKGLDVSRLWSEGKGERKPSAAFVVIGHVDHGKSTLMGRLLLDTGAVSSRDIDRYKKQAAAMNKASFALAWVMDTGTEERARGVTVDIAQHHFSIEEVDFTILDAPGHRDFVPNMIGGAAMADFAVLVIDANQLDSGLKGQTREHILLAKAVGIERIVVAVNKMDSTTPQKWDQSLFESVRDRMQKLLSELGFKDENVKVLPCSGLSGDNVVNKPSTTGASAWVTEHYPTLLQELQNSLPVEPDLKTIQRPFNMRIADVFRGGITNPLSVSGRISNGNVQLGDTIVVLPSDGTATIKGIDVHDEPRDWAVAGQLATLHLTTDIEAQNLRAGDALCSSAGSNDPTQSVRVVKNFTARIEAVETLLPQSVDVHVARLHFPAALTRLVALVDERGEIVKGKKRPRTVQAGQRAVVRIQVDDDKGAGVGGGGVPLGQGEKLVLRANGGTVAVGEAEEVLVDA